MKNFTTITATAAVAAGLSAAAIGLAGAAAAAPSGSGDARATISSLEAEGNRVIVSRQGNTPLAQAEVVAVRPGPQFTQWVWDAQGDDRIQVPAGRTYFVTVK
ncbi:hypothetical protein [Mycobacterium sp. SMC-4]|uniref:hypothetical protein n=1 Tax=Mycobacterium sp. SMC-4 TaxID=2857059 RepID=UPI0021B18E2B|nr:hypothetical protein [Mycobacterium sp. SMC-4]UXA17850.1 hypothetical protein KXD98_24705 [Mycobacterium sp. SMC-4]